MAKARAQATASTGGSLTSAVAAKASKSLPDCLEVPLAVCAKRLVCHRTCSSFFHHTDAACLGWVEFEDMMQACVCKGWGTQNGRLLLLLLLLESQVTSMIPSTQSESCRFKPMSQAWFQDNRLKCTPDYSSQLPCPGFSIQHLPSIICLPISAACAHHCSHFPCRSQKKWRPYTFYAF